MSLTFAISNVKVNFAHLHPNLDNYYLCASTQTLPKALEPQTINNLT